MHVRYESPEHGSIELTRAQVDDLLGVLNVAAGIDWVAPPPDVQELLPARAQAGSPVAAEGDAALEAAEGQLAVFKFTEPGAAFSARDCRVLVDRAREGLAREPWPDNVVGVVERVLAFVSRADGFVVSDVQ